MKKTKTKSQPKTKKNWRETNPKKCIKMGGDCNCSLAEMGKYC
jgi:hypothetical protein